MRYDLSGAIGRYNHVNVAGGRNRYPLSVRKGDVEGGGANHNHLVTDGADHMGRFRERCAGRNYLHDQPAVRATASAASSARSPSDAQSSQSCTASATGTPVIGLARRTVHGSGAMAIRSVPRPGLPVSG